LLLGIFLLWQYNAVAQINATWQYNGKDVQIEQLVKALPNTVISASDIDMSANKLCAALWQKGYLQAYTTSTIDSNNISTTIEAGTKYTWANISLDTVARRIAQQANTALLSLNGKAVSAATLGAMAEQILQYCEQHGYPFAQMYLHDAKISSNTIAAELKVDRGPLILIDSINIEGDVELSDKFLYQHLGIRPGDLYNQKILNNISRKLQELNFAQADQAWRMSFGLDKNILSIYLKDKSANSADVIVGLAPSNSTFGNRFFLTGDIRLNFVNTLRNGEQLNISWQNLQYKSPRLNIDASVPYLFGTAFGATAKFNYVKLDTSFSTVNREVGVLYHVSANSYIKAYFSSFTSNLIRVDTQYVRLQRRLPLNLDYNISSYGLQYVLTKLDRIVNPRKGISISINGNAGTRRTVRNGTIENLFDPIAQQSFAYLYDTAKNNTLRIWLQSNIAYYTPLRKALSLKLNLASGYIQNTNLMRNDLFQIGGYRLLRGFDEASLFTSGYAIATIEPRYSLNRTSYVFALVDAGTVQLPLSTSKYKNVLGFGAGLSLLTKSGTFNIVYAFGNASNTGIQLRNSKIHFGYLNQF
jgi:outer membrane protein assembly factor BamA